MAQNNNLLLLVAGGIGLFLYSQKNKPQRRLTSRVIVDDPLVIQPGSQESKVFEEQIDGVVDVEKTGLSIPQAIEKAKEIANSLNDAKVLVVKGAKKIMNVRNGKKKVKRTSRKFKAVKIAKRPSKKAAIKFGKKHIKPYSFGF